MKTIDRSHTLSESPEVRAFGPLNRLEKALGLVAIAGAAAAIIAALWPSREDLRWTAAHDPKPAAQQVLSSAPLDASIERSPAPPVELEIAAEQARSSTEAATQLGVEPKLGLPHQDQQTDYEQLALEELASGRDLQAYQALRKHLYFHPATPEMLLELGRMGRELKDFAIAELALDEAEKRSPEQGEVLVERARLELELGDLEAAQKAARRAIKLDRESAAAWNVAGRISMEQSQWERAEASLRRAVGIEPTDGLIHNNLGLLYIHMKRSTQALDSMETAVELFGEEVPYFVYNNLGLAYELGGRLEQAQDAFQKALDTNPGYARAQANLQRVEDELGDHESLERSPPDPQQDTGTDAL